MLLNLHLFALDSCLRAQVNDDDKLFIAKLNALKCEQGVRSTQQPAGMAMKKT